jgi:hypothetical protein
MTNKQTPARRKFAHIWDKIDYLYHKLLYWLYQRADQRMARRYAKQLERLVQKADPDHAAVFGEEIRSLAREAQGDTRRAIKHRESEISLIHQLYKAVRGKPYEKAALKGYDYGDLSDRLDLLAALYHDSGDLDKAIATLLESKKLCEEHGIKFDGADLLQEYMAEEKERVANYVSGVEVSENGRYSVKQSQKPLGECSMIATSRAEVPEEWLRDIRLRDLRIKEPQPILALPPSIPQLAPTLPLIGMIPEEAC